MSLNELSKKFFLTLIEADGAKEMPIKGYLDKEPCTPLYSSETIGIIPISIIGKKINSSYVFRVSEFLKITDTQINDEININILIKYISYKKGLFKNSRTKSIFLNQVESTHDLENAIQLKETLKNTTNISFKTIFAGSIKNNI